MRASRSVALEAKPEHNRRYTNARQTRAGNATVGQTLTLLGTAFDQGVTQHRVDQINKFYNPSATLDYEGQGMQIGYISDSFGATTTVTTPATDVANYDLPGAANNPAGNTQPVVVLARISRAAPTKAAPWCRSATRWLRRPAWLSPRPTPARWASPTTSARWPVWPATRIPPRPSRVSPPTRSATTWVTQDEPFFEDGIVGNAVNDVAAAGVSYFSSAGNDIGTYDYDADFSLRAQRHGPDRRDQRRAGRHQHQPGQRSDEPVPGRLPQFQSLAARRTWR